MHLITLNEINMLCGLLLVINNHWHAIDILLVVRRSRVLLAWIGLSTLNVLPDHDVLLHELWVFTLVLHVMHVLVTLAVLDELLSQLLLTLLTDQEV